MEFIEIEVWTPRHFIVNPGQGRNPDLDHIREQFRMFYQCEPTIISRMVKETKTDKDGNLESIEGQHPIAWGKKAIQEKHDEWRILAAWKTWRLITTPSPWNPQPLTRPYCKNGGI